MKNKNYTKNRQISRRNFIRASAAISIAAVLPTKERLFAAGSDKLRVGLIGCGSRGTGAAKNCLDAAPNVELVAMADLFKDRLQLSLHQLKTNDKEQMTDWSSSTLWQNAHKVKAAEDTCFVGFDAYKKLIACDVDLIILATPPHFRPAHLKAAIEAGKHLFMEKPVAVDPVGVRSIIASSELAEKKGLAIVAGTQRHHQNHYIELIKRVHDGQIGEIVAAQCYWNEDDSANWGVFKRQPDWSDMEWQLRNWFFFTWLCGDHIVEQHLHNIDAVNWAIGTHPVTAMGMGGRQVRTGPEYGNIFDHFAVEYEYPNGARVLSMCRQTDGCHYRVSENIVGTKGSLHTDGVAGYIKGQNPFKYDGPNVNPYLQEHIDLINSIRTGKPINEGRRVAESTLTAIMGRMSAYTGRALKWDWVMNASKLDLSPPSYEFGDLPVRPVAVPGKTKLI